MTHKLGLHWQRTHPDNKRDFEHIERMQYRSVKLFGPEWSNADFCRDLLAVLPRDAYILARDHPLSEQKQDMWDDPEGTGKRHADEWADKLHRGITRLPTDRTFFLGINEPDATTGDRSAIDRYNVAFLTRLQHHGLRGGAFNFSTGHPRTVDGTDNTPADYSVFEGSHAAIVRGHHIGVAHIYGTAAVPLVPGNYDRLQACPWTDIEWVIAECGIDEHVIGGGPHVGYLGAMDEPSQYPVWMDTFITGVDLRNIHSYEFFTFDHAKPWGTFDVRAHMDAVEQYDWQHGRAAHDKSPDPIHNGDSVSQDDHKTHLPNVQSGNPEPTAAPEQPPLVISPDAEMEFRPMILDPLVMEAFIAIESGGRAFGPDGKLLIRFEAHIFMRRAKIKSSVIDHFQFSENRPWMNQMFRTTPTGTFKFVHASQASEWEAFELARGMDEKAALESISMGAPQIMGFNHARIGYGGAAQMFDAFSRSEHAQIVGLVNYMLSDPQLTSAIQQRDWHQMATLYNGSGQAEHYAGLLKAKYDEL